MAMEEKPKKGAERLKPVPLPKRKRMTQAQLDARPKPMQKPKATRSQAQKRSWKKRKAQVSPEQRARLEQGRKTQEKQREEEKKIQVSLRTFHVFGQERYGPGTAWVPRRIVLAVLEQDRAAVEAEDQLYTERSSMIVPGGRGNSAVSVQVANPNFRSVWEGPSSPIFDLVSGKGIVDVGQGPRF